MKVEIIKDDSSKFIVYKNTKGNYSKKYIK